MHREEEQEQVVVEEELDKVVQQEVQDKEHGEGWLAEEDEEQMDQAEEQLDQEQEKPYLAGAEGVCIHFMLQKIICGILNQK